MLYFVVTNLHQVSISNQVNIKTFLKILKQVNKSRHWVLKKYKWRIFIVTILIRKKHSDHKCQWKWNILSLTILMTGYYIFDTNSDHISMINQNLYKNSPKNIEKAVMKRITFENKIIWQKMVWLEKNIVKK